MINVWTLWQYYRRLENGSGILQWLFHAPIKRISEEHFSLFRSFKAPYLSYEKSIRRASVTFKEFCCHINSVLTVSTYNSITEKKNISIIMSTLSHNHTSKAYVPNYNLNNFLPFYPETYLPHFKDWTC